MLPFTGRLVGAKRTQQGSRPRGFSSEIASRCDADAFLPAEGSIRQRPLLRGRAGVAGVPSPGHASQGIAQEPKRAPHLLPHQEERLLHREVRDPKGQPEGHGEMAEQSYDPIVPVKVGNRRASARKRPRYPPEGRGEQAHASVEGNIIETLNSNHYVHRHRQTI